MMRDIISHSNLLERRAFSINIPAENYVKEADFFGVISGKEEDKFSKTDLTSARCEKVDAPYVKEFPLVLECSLTHTIELGLHTQFIGEIVDYKADQSVLDEKRIPDMEKVKPIECNILVS